MVYMQIWIGRNMTSEQIDDLWTRLSEQLDLLVGNTSKTE